MMTQHHSAAPVTESSEAEVGEDDVEEEEDAERHNHQNPREALLKVSGQVGKSGTDQIEHVVKEK